MGQPNACGSDLADQFGGGWARYGTRPDLLRVARVSAIQRPKLLSVVHRIADMPNWIPRTVRSYVESIATGMRAEAR